MRSVWGVVTLWARGGGSDEASAAYASEKFLRSAVE